MKRILLSCIRLYQKHLSGLKGYSSCKFYPTCSKYSIEAIEKAGLAPYYTDHGVDVYPVSASGVPFTAAYGAVALRRMLKA